MVDDRSDAVDVVVPSSVVFFLDASSVFSLRLLVLLHSCFVQQAAAAQLLLFIICFLPPNTLRSGHFTSQTITK